MDKACKDKSLVGKDKETVMQVSMSKKCGHPSRSRRGHRGAITNSKGQALC